MFVQNRPASIVLCILSTLVLIAVPYRAELQGFQPTISLHQAVAKEGNKGNGKGASSKDGGASSKGASTGSNKGSAGKGGSHQGSGKAASPGGPHRSGADNRSGNTRSAPADRIGLSAPSMSVLHSNGMREKISGGRYEMKDARGRTIVNRAATQSDLARLRGFQR
jgi:hypothetical protein